MARMSAIFGLFKEFLHVHMIIYRKLTQNITKDQKRVKKDQKRHKIPGIWKNMISHPNNGM